MRRLRLTLSGIVLLALLTAQGHAGEKGDHSGASLVGGDPKDEGNPKNFRQFGFSIPPAEDGVGYTAQVLADGKVADVIYIPGKLLLRTYGGDERSEREIELEGDVAADVDRGRLSSDGASVLVPLKGGGCRVLGFTDGRKLAEFESDAGKELAISPGGGLVAFLSKGSLMLGSVADGSTRQIEKDWHPVADHLLKLMFSSGGGHILAIQGRGVSAWDLKGNLVAQKSIDLAFFLSPAPAPATGALSIPQLGPSPNYNRIDSGVFDADVSADGKLLAVAADARLHLMPTGKRGKARNASAHMMSGLQVTGSGIGDGPYVAGSARHVAFSPDGAHIATAGSGEVWIWNRKKLEAIKRIPFPQTLRDLRFSPDGAWVEATGPVRVTSIGLDGKVDNKHSGHIPLPKSERTPRTPTGIAGLSYSHGGDRLVSTGTEGGVCVWTTAEGEPQVIGQAFASPGYDSERIPIGFSADDSWIQVGQQFYELKDGALQAHDRAEGIERRYGGGHEGMIPLSIPGRMPFASSHDGSRVAIEVPPYRNRVQVADLSVIDSRTNPVSELEFEEHGYRLSFSPSGNLIVGQHIRYGDSRKRILRLWDAESGKVVWTLSYNQEELQNAPEPDSLGYSPQFDARFSPQGNWIGELDANGNLRIRSVEDAELLAILAPPHGRIHCFAFSPDGERVAAGTTHHGILEWDVRLTIEAGPGPVGVEEFEIMLGNEDRMIPVEGDLDERARRVVAISRDGARVAAGVSDNGDVRILETILGKELGTVETGLKLGVHALTFVADDDHLALSGRAEDGQQHVQLWDLKARKLISDHKPRMGANYCVAASPDGSSFAAGGYEQLLVFDSRSGELRSSTNFCVIRRDNIIGVGYTREGRLGAVGHWIFQLRDKPDGPIVGSFSHLRTSGNYGGAICPSGNWVAELRGGQNYPLVLWDIENKKVKWEKETGVQGGSPIFHPSGKWVVLFNREGALVYEIKTGRRLAGILGSTGTGCFDRTGERLLVPVKDGIAIWDFGRALSYAR